MNKQTRIERIAEVVKRDEANPYGKIEIPWKGVLKSMPVYQIPLEYLVFNKYNGRILSRTKSLESQGQQIDAESPEGEALIAKLLLDSNKGRNAQTETSIKTLGQEKPGIITRDGIIIDGNRRAMLLRKSGKSKYFKTVVLDVALEEDPLEIEQLETTYQMGEDQKLDYNPIEKYLKAKGLNQRGISVADIALWMGQPESKVKEYLEVMAVMDDYLDYLGYNGIYTQLDEREDPFINLTKWTKTFYGGDSQKAFDGYRDGDVDDLKTISFDYIRARFEGKRFRILADGLKTNHFFGDKDIWTNFRDAHFKNTQAIKDAESKIDFNADSLEIYLRERDRSFEMAITPILTDNIETYEKQLGYKKSANEPLKLVNDATSALDAIDQKHKASSAQDVITKIAKLNEKTFEILKAKSPAAVLTRVVEILSSLDPSSHEGSKEELLEQVKEIEHLAYKLEKEVKQL